MSSEPESPAPPAAPATDPAAMPPAAPTPWWRRALPFVVAAGLIAFTLHKVDLGEVWRDLRSVNAPAFLLFNLVFVLALLTADAFATTVAYGRAVAPMRFRVIWTMRGASYLPAILNHHVGQAFFTYYVARAHGIALARMAGGTLLVYVSWLGCLLGAATIALAVDGQPILRPLVLLGAGVAYLAVIAWRPARLARIKLLAPLFEAGLGGHVLALAVRLTHFVVLFLGTWLPFFFFGVNIPFAKAIVYMPLVMVAGTLPIAPQGAGTRDLVAVLYLAPFAAGVDPEKQRAAVLATTGSWALALTLIQVVMGLLLRRAMPALTAGAKTEPKAQAEAGQALAP